MKNKYMSVSLRPFKYLSPSVHTKGLVFLIVLIPQVVMLFLTRSWNALQVLFCTTAASFAVTGIDCFFEQKRAYDWISALVRALIIGLLIPSDYPLFSIFLVTFSVLLVVTYFLGGFADSWVNPVALTVAVCWMLSAHFFPESLLQTEDLSSKNLSLLFIQNGNIPVMPIDARITSFLNKTVFNLFSVSIPEGFVSLLWDSHSLIPAFRFNLLTLFTSIFLISFDIIGMLIPAIYLVVYCLLVRFVAPVFYGGTVGQGDMLFALLTSGTLFCTVFLLQWYGTMPITLTGKIAYGIISGIAVFLIVGVGDSGVGSVFTILVVNVIVPLIHAIETAAEKRYLNHILLPKVEAFKDGQHA